MNVDFKKLPKPYFIIQPDYGGCLGYFYWLTVVMDAMVIYWNWKALRKHLSIFRASKNGVWNGIRKTIKLFTEYPLTLIGMNGIKEVCNLHSF